MYKEIKENLVKNLTEKQNMAGAILLNGDWGSGKTFFVENTLIPALNKKGKNVIYVSLFGHESIESVKKSLKSKFLLNVDVTKNTTNSTLKNIKAGATFLSELLRGYTEKKTGIDPAELLNSVFSALDTLEFLPSESIIIFDDLERRGNLDILEVYGLISQLIEQKKCRVLVLANSSKIYPDKKKLDYHEKSFHRTIQFEAGIFEAFDTIVKKYASAPAKKYLTKNKSLIISEFEDCQYKNIRTLIKLVGYINDIISHSIELPEEHLTFCIQFIIFKSEYGFLIPNKEIYERGYSTYAEQKIELEKNANKKEDLKATLTPYIQISKEFEEVFKHKKSFKKRFRYTYFFSEQIFNYLATDILNANLLIEEILPASNQNSMYKVYEQIRHKFWMLSDEKETNLIINEFKTALKNYVDIGSTEFLDIYIYMCRIHKTLNISMEEIDNLVSSYLESSELIKKTTVSDHLIRMGIEKTISKSANRMLDKIVAVQNNYKCNELKNVLITAIKKHDYLAISEITDLNTYIKVCTDNDVLTATEKIIDEHPRTYNDFYMLAFSRIRGMPDSPKVKKALLARIRKFKRKQTDKIRIALLNNIIICSDGR